MFIGFGTLLLFAVCYVVAESWLEVDKAHRHAKREQQERERVTTNRIPHEFRAWESWRTTCARTGTTQWILKRPPA